METTIMSPKAAQLEKTHTLTPLEESVLRSKRLPMQADNPETPDSIRETMRGIQSAAMERLQWLGMPTKKQEAWKYCPVHTLIQQSMVLPQQPGALDAAVLKQAGHLEPLGRTRLAFVDGFYSPRNSKVAEQQEGMIVSDTRTAYTEHEEALLPVWQQQANDSFDAFHAMNMATHTNGAYVYISPDEDKSSEAIHIACFSGHQTEQTATFQQHFIQLGGRSKATIVFQCLGLPLDEAIHRLMHQVLTVDVAENAELDLVVLHDDAIQHGWQMMCINGQVARNATLNLTTVSLGLGIARDHLQLNINGEDAIVRHHGLTIHQQHGQSYLHAQIHHNVPNTQSHQLVKSILDDASKNDFDATIIVAKDAQKTDATQLNKNLLLSDKARAWTRPQLKIDADDVKCAHGATVGQLNPEEMFYLASRGMPPETARCLLTYGFAEDALSLVSHARLHRYLSTQIVAALGQTDSPIAYSMECGTCKTAV
jgi:Fe-S cluster assembly protein SufD